MLKSMLIILRLDVKSRLSSTQFWWGLLGLTALTLILFPSPEAGYAVVDINGYRGLYNSAWMGISLALVGSSFLFLIGYYLIVGSIEQDRRKGMLTMLLSSRLSISRYLIIKFCSHLFVLNVFGLAMMVTAIFQQVVIAEEGNVIIQSYLIPYFVLFEPIMFLVAAIAILFEVVPKLASQHGNWGYFFLWTLLSVANMLGLSPHKALTTQLEQALEGLSVDTHISIGFSALEQPQSLFHWTGISFDSAIWLPVLMQFLLASLFMVLAVYLANGCYHLLYYKKALNQKDKQITKNQKPNINYRFVRLFTSKIKLFPLQKAELELLFIGMNPSVFILAMLLSMAATFAPINFVQSVMLPVVALLPLLSITQMCTRDRLCGTHDLIAANLNIQTLNWRRLQAAIGFMILLSAGFILRFIYAGEVLALVHLLGFIILLPTLTMLFTLWFGTSKFFELGYLLLWMSGPINQASQVDFIGVTKTYSAMVNTWIAVIISIVLVALTLAKRAKFRRVDNLVCANG
jgi:hypothetical protein